MNKPNIAINYRSVDNYWEYLGQTIFVTTKNESELSASAKERKYSLNLGELRLYEFTNTSN